jgi:hypothetical protein
VVGGAPMMWCSGYGGDKIETRLSGEKNDKVEMTFYSSGCESRTVWRSCSVAVVWIQCFSFDSRVEAAG